VFRDCEAIGGAVSEALFLDGLCLPSGTAMFADDQERAAAVMRSTAR
jgi:pyridoxal phosphate-dependent aminotransferase EpsN